MTSTILIGQRPNLLIFWGGDHASATPLESDKMATSAKKAKTKSRYRNKVARELPPFKDVPADGKPTSRVSYKDICFHSLWNFVA